MPRTNHVAAYGGKRKCQHQPDPENHKLCRLPRADHPAAGHDYDPGCLRCEKCGADIKPGDPYKFVKVKRQRGGIKRDRCNQCPHWKPSELTTSEFLRIIYAAGENAPEVDVDSVHHAEITEQLDALRDHYAEAAHEAAQVRIDAADNMEAGFGHETEISMGLREEGETAEYAADELESMTFDFDGDDPDELDEEDEDHDDNLEQALGELASWAEEQLSEIENAFEEANS